MFGSFLPSLRSSINHSLLGVEEPTLLCNHMGNTSSRFKGGRDALEGVFGDGRTNAVCGSPASRRADGGTLQGVRYLPQDGYKIFDRYQECGIQGLTDRSRRPYRYAKQLPFQVENFVLNVKREHPSWGARKIRERLIRRFSGISIPAKAPFMRCSIATA